MGTMVSGLTSSVVAMMVGKLMRQVTATRVASGRCTGSGMKQMASPAPNPAVTPRRCRVHSFGSEMRGPNTRSGQRSRSVCGSGMNFLIHWRGIGSRL